MFAIAMLGGAAWAMFAADPPVPPAPVAAPAESSLPLFADADQRLETALAKPVTLRCRRKPLSEVLALVSVQLAVPIQLDEQSLEIAKVAADRPVTIAAKGLAGRQVLAQVLEPLGLVAQAEGHAVRIVDRDSAEPPGLFSRAYPVADLALAPHGYAVKNHVRELEQLLQRTIDPEDWEDNGGASFMVYFPPTATLVVTAPTETHERISQTLAALRATRAQTAALLEAANLRPLPELLASLEESKTPPNDERSVSPERKTAESEPAPTAKPENGPTPPAFSMPPAETDLRRALDLGEWLRDSAARTPAPGGRPEPVPAAPVRPTPPPAAPRPAPPKPAAGGPDGRAENWLDWLRESAEQAPARPVRGKT